MLLSKWLMWARPSCLVWWILIVKFMKKYSDQEKLEVLKAVRKEYPKQLEIVVRESEKEKLKQLEKLVS